MNYALNTKDFLKQIKKVKENKDLQDNWSATGCGFLFAKFLDDYEQIGGQRFVGCEILKNLIKESETL